MTSKQIVTGTQFIIIYLDEFKQFTKIEFRENSISILSCLMYYVIFTRTETESDTKTDKNGLYRIPWTCSYCTETPMPFGTVPTLSDLVSVSVLVTVGVNMPLG